MSYLACFFCQRSFEISGQLEELLSNEHFKKHIEDIAGETSIGLMNFGTLFFLPRTPIFLCSDCLHLREQTKQ